MVLDTSATWNRPGARARPGLVLSLEPETNLKPYRFGPVSACWECQWRPKYPAGPLPYTPAGAVSARADAP